jgi:hypothetical protein
MKRQTGLAPRRSELIEIPISSNFLLVIPKVVSKPARKGQPLLIPRAACNNSIGVAEEQRSAEWTKNCHLLLYMTLRTMLALCFQLD